jgi:hypothetical protein
VYIRADYVTPTGGRIRGIAPHAYAVDPTAPAVPLAYVRGDVFLATTETVLGGVTVEIIEGEGVGKRAVTLESGSYFFEFLKLGAPFTARASKQGYVTEVKTHPGVIDHPLGFPTNAFLHFNLTPVQ